MTDLPSLAASLSEAQREAIIERRGSHEVLVSAEMDPLWFCIRKHGPDDFTIALTETGLALRDYMKEKDDGN